MVQIEMDGFRIKHLSIENSIEGNGPMKLKSSFDLDADIDDKCETAAAVLEERIELDGHFEQYHLVLALEDFFHISGVKNKNDRKIVHLKLYDALFPQAEQILAYLALDCGFAGLRIEKQKMDLEYIHFGEKPEKKPGKIIEMRLGNSSDKLKIWSVVPLLPLPFPVVSSISDCYGMERGSRREEWQSVIVRLQPDINVIFI